MTSIFSGVVSTYRKMSRFELSDTVRTSGMDELVDLLMERSDKAIWH